MNNFQNLWTEKYRPRTLEDIVLPEATKQRLLAYKESQEIPHLLFIGSAGCGKSTLSKIIVKDILHCDYLYINASDENGIDTIRTKLTGFAQTKSFNAGIKTIILDEGDSISNEGQRALRNLMEEYASITRFIITGNYNHKIIEPLRSRCQTLSFDNTPQDLAKRCFHILRSENITLPEEQKPLLVALIKKNYPDFRKTINELQQSSTSGILNITDTKTSSEFLTNIFNILKSNNVVEVRKLLITNERLFQNDYHALMKNFLNFLYTAEIDVAKKRESMLIIAEHLYRHSFVIDTEINSFACFINLQKIFTE